MLTSSSLKKQFTPEQVLTVLLVRIYFKKSNREEVLDFINQEKINWDIWLKLVSVHGIRAFIFSIIEVEAIIIPDQHFKHLKQHTFKVGLQSMQQVSILNKLLKALSAMKIQVVPYKGVTFASAYFGSLNKRESSDIDLLVAPEDVQKIRNYLHNHGYTPHTDVHDEYVDFFVKHFKELTFKSPKDDLKLNCTVEIKWLLLGKFLGNFETHNFFEPHIQPFKLGALELYKLSPTYDFLAVASNHLIKEPLYAFKYVIDLVAILQMHSTEIDAELVLSTMNKHGYRELFLAGMDVCNDLLGVNLKEWQSKRIKDEFLLSSSLAYPRLRGAEKLSFQVIKTINRFDPDRWRRMRRKWVVLTYYFIPSMLDFYLIKPSKYSIFYLYLKRPFRLFSKKFIKVSEDRKVS